MVATFLRRPHDGTWHDHALDLWERVIEQRYGAANRKRIGLRTPKLDVQSAPYTALVHKDSPPSGGYGGMSLVLFPGAEGCLLAMVVGTQGLAPDESILTRPGHARRCRAMAEWINGIRGASSDAAAWAKSDPAAIESPLPAVWVRRLQPWSSAVSRYSNEIYFLIDTRSLDGETMVKVFFAMLDFTMNARGLSPLAAHRAAVDDLQREVLARLMVSPTFDEVAGELARRRFVILQGPPGVGKTRLANVLRRDTYGGRGQTVQFHASYGQEQFVGGLAPVAESGTFGFRPQPGVLMRAAEAARQAGDAPYLLHIDEINRADLARVLCEALYLLELPRPGDTTRTVELPYDFGAPWGRYLTLPPNLHILGTMNSADRSTAILDLAVRRRFSFMSLWPSASALSGSAALASEAFNELRQLFIDEAPEAALDLMPGHAYFMGDGTPDDDAQGRLRHELLPLLQGYQRQGLLPGMDESIDAYVQWLAARC